MNIYFVDSENVGLYPLRVNTDSEYKVIYFSTKEYPYDLLENEKSIVVEHNGCKDALDFIIDTYLGFTVHKYEDYKSNNNYIIVSNDSGYDNVISFWKNLGYLVSRMSIQKAIIPIEVGSDVPSLTEDKFKLSNTNNGYEIPITNNNNMNVASVYINTMNNTDKVKLQHIYNDWYRSKSRKKDIICSNLRRAFKDMSSKTINIIANYLMSYEGNFKVE